MTRKERKLLADLVELAEGQAVAIDMEWGDCRTKELLYFEDEMPVEIVRAKNYLSAFEERLRRK